MSIVDIRHLRSGPMLHTALPAALTEQIRTMYEVLGESVNMTLEEWQAGFQRVTDPEREIGRWQAITAVWIDYHEQYLDDVVMSHADEDKLFSALLLMTSGINDPSQLGVPALIGKRLLNCYEQFEKELEEQSLVDDEANERN